MMMYISLIVTYCLTEHTVNLSVLTGASNMHTLRKLVAKYYFLFYSKIYISTQPKSKVIIIESLENAILKNHSFYIFNYTCNKS